MKTPFLHLPIPRLLASAIEQSHQKTPLSGVIYQPESLAIALFARSSETQVEDLELVTSTWPWAFLGAEVISQVAVHNPSTQRLVLIVWLSDKLRPAGEETPAFRYCPPSHTILTTSRLTELTLRADKKTFDLPLPPIEVSRPLPGTEDSSKRAGVSRKQNVALKLALALRFPNVVNIVQNPRKGFVSLSVTGTSLRSLLIHKNWFIDAIQETGIAVAAREWDVTKYRSRVRGSHYIIKVPTRQSDAKTVTTRFLLEKEKKRLAKDNSSVGDEIRALVSDPAFLKQVQITRFKKRAAGIKKPVA